MEFTSSQEADGRFFSPSQRSAPRVHGRAHRPPAARRRHAFAPVPHQTHALPPAPRGTMGTRDGNFDVHLQRAASGSSFAPAAAFHAATQTPFSSSKGGRWAALHVRIAWKIYYNKKFKKPNSVSGTLTPEGPSGTGLPDPEPGQGSDLPSCTHANPDFARGVSGVRGEFRTTAHRLGRCRPSDLRAPSPEPCRNLPATQRETAMHHRQEQPDEKEPRAVEGSPPRDKPRDQGASAELQVRRGRKRQLERDAFIQAKRLKKEPLDDVLDGAKTFHAEPSWFSMTHTHPSSLTTPVHHRSLGHLSVLYPNSGRCDGGAAALEISPYQTAPWELLWNRREQLHSRLSALKESPLRPAEAFSGFFVPPLYFHPALGTQDPPYLGGREFLHAHPENCHPHPCRSLLPHPGFLTTSC